MWCNQARSACIGNDEIFISLYLHFGNICTHKNTARAINPYCMERNFSPKRLPNSDSLWNSRKKSPLGVKQCKVDLEFSKNPIFQYLSNDIHIWYNDTCVLFWKRLKNSCFSCENTWISVRPSWSFGVNSLIFLSLNLT